MHPSNNRSLLLAGRKKIVSLELRHARTLLLYSHTSHILQCYTYKKLGILNLHQAYNIRAGLFVESLVSDPSTQARPRQQ